MSSLRRVEDGGFADVEGYGLCYCCFGFDFVAIVSISLLEATERQSMAMSDEDL
jgi:hypothetical protein